MLTLKEHMARGYDFYVYGKSKVWQPAMLVDDLKANEDFKRDAQALLSEINQVLAVRRKDYVSEVQQRILRDAFASLKSST